MKEKIEKTFIIQLLPIVRLEQHQLRAKISPFSPFLCINHGIFNLRY